ncbi:plasminogen-binding N-terminal domain-containing protein [Sulfuricurvum sp.]|uniref:plasminogen-binding N-terminal domain-containing protein n=1 Tax=Sulfuricurvum sp. TaxID=2025608 RepID=UPI002E3389A4|nr:plasminogen-binding N-terminal domain-containing protein [Sulfuricurvum sp.]HEX5330701.1 plasminogen-binding N-terminal domain-containing protein [Sulfuricurvum sp.]
MRIWLITLIACSVLNASSITAPLLEVDGARATIIAENLREGMSGFIVRQFDADHSTIIANARVEQANSTNNRAILAISEYTGLHQDALPSGIWTPKPSDIAVLAYDYKRALLIAPNDDTYDAIAKSISGVEWIHPDNYAAFLSNEGHQTPLVDDFKSYCTANSVGLLYVQSANQLFTLDCKSFTLLQSTPFAKVAEKEQTPFYTRVPTIRGAWWGEGSSSLKSYEPYYLDIISLNNPKNKVKE